MSPNHATLSGIKNTEFCFIQILLNTLRNQIKIYNVCLSFLTVLLFLGYHENPSEESKITMHAQVKKIKTCQFSWNFIC